MVVTLKKVRVRPAGPKKANEHRSLKNVRVVAAAKK
jgi:hypothetical protein